MCQTAGTPSPPTGSSCGGWGLGQCWSSWSDGSLGRCPTETVRTTANNRGNWLDFSQIFQKHIKINLVKVNMDFNLNMFKVMLSSSVLMIDFVCMSSLLSPAHEHKYYDCMIHRNMITVSTQDCTQQIFVSQRFDHVYIRKICCSKTNAPNSCLSCSNE